METKEEYYERTLKRREIVADSNNLICTCPSKACEWKGKCKECVAIHRFNKDHLPMCLQSLIKDKVEALAFVCELIVTEKECTPAEYKIYVRERDMENEQKL
jgi:hypothetical protein